MQPLIRFNAAIRLIQCSHLCFHLMQNRCIITENSLCVQVIVDRPVIYLEARICCPLTTAPKTLGIKSPFQPSVKLKAIMNHVRFSTGKPDTTIWYSRISESKNCFQHSICLEDEWYKL